MTCIVIALMVSAIPALAQDKGQYHLFNPTPREMLRELAPDRPDFTESPFTVDAGHVQLETSFVDYTRHRGDVARRTLSVLPSNIKLGLTHNIDLQLVLEPLVHIDLRDADNARGFGTSQIRAKINLWGNDGGDTALGIMPFVEFPTADNEIDPGNHLQGGLIVPYAMDLREGLSLGLMAEFDIVRDDDDDDYDLEFVHTAALGIDLTDKFGTYVEYIGIAPITDTGNYAALLGTGVTYKLSGDLQLDAGCNIGLTNNTDRYQLFTGITVRL